MEETPNHKKEGKIARIAITCFGDKIAPCFSATRLFRIWEIGSDNSINCSELSFDEIGGLSRLRLLRRAEVNVLICNGIEEQARQLLETAGCRVVDNIVGNATDALYGYLVGKIQAGKMSKAVVPIQLQPHSTDLMEWTADLFANYGWMIQRFTQSEAYPIDFRATKTCPLCNKQVQVAACCGAHSYNIESEIREFGHVTARGYNARVYVHRATPYMINWCSDYEIELLDPESCTNMKKKREDRNILPPLRGRIKDHPNINVEQLENEQ